MSDADMALSESSADDLVVAANLRASVDDACLDDDEANAAAADAGAEADDEAQEAEPEEPEDPEAAARRAEALGVAQHLLLSAPPGEFREVLADVEVLVPEGLLSKGMVAGVARAHNARALNVARAEDGTKIVLCAAGEAGGPTTFRDAASGRVYAVDHVALTAEEAAKDDGHPLLSDEAEEVAAEMAEAEAEDPLEAPRGALQQALAAYASSRFGRSGRAAVHVADGSLAACVRGSTANLRNFYAGAWASSWTVAPAGGGFSVAGSVEVKAHYFEDGNVQLSQARAFAARSVADAGAAAALIEASETEVHDGLEAMYDDMSLSTIKAMRRTMPVTRAKMKWNVHEVALNKNFRK